MERKPQLLPHQIESLKVDGQNRRSKLLVYNEWMNTFGGITNSGLKRFSLGIDLERWYIVFPEGLETEVIRFVNHGIQFGEQMGFKISKPIL